MSKKLIVLQNVVLPKTLVAVHDYKSHLFYIYAYIFVGLSNYIQVWKTNFEKLNDLIHILFDKQTNYDFLN